MNLFCLPFAGGGGYSYKGFADIIPAGMQLIPVELPGRGSRRGEKLLYSISHLTEDIFCQVKDRLNEPYIIYGHSMGALTGLLLTRYIREKGLPLPQHLFVSGCSAPRVLTKGTASSLLPQEEFFNMLKEYGGCPPEVLLNHQLMCFFEPVLRADFRIVESFNYEEDVLPDISIDVFLGKEDSVTLEQGMAWQEETSGNVNVRQFPGNHFFIYGNEKQIMNVILQRLLAARRHIPHHSK